MCYVIELKDKYFPTDFLSVTVEKKEGVKMDFITWKLTSDHDYLGVSWLESFMPFEFISKFEDIFDQTITTVQTIKKPLECKMYNAEYVSKQQCLVYDFFDKHFSPCSVKCIPIQMRGFRYINSSYELKNCTKLDDEVCNGGPTVWKELKKRFKTCAKPCDITLYDHSVIERKEKRLTKDNANRATFEFVNSDVRQIEKEVLLYDFSDLIGTIGGSCGIAVGISVFTVFSCCIESFLKLLSLFEREKEEQKLFIQKCSQIPIYEGRINAKSQVITNPC